MYADQMPACVTNRPSNPLMGAIEGADKTLCQLGEKVELLGQRLCYILQPESPAPAVGCVPPAPRPPQSDAVERLGNHAARIHDLIARLDSYLSRLDV